MDIPTYLSHPVQLATVTYSDPPVTKLHRALASPAPKQDKKTPAKTRWLHILPYLLCIYVSTISRWTLFCIAVWFLTVCIVLVGTMLSYTSEYQVKEIYKYFPQVLNTHWIY